MCLSTLIAEFDNHENNDECTVWKVFVINSDGIASPIYPHSKTPRNEWIQAHRRRVYIAKKDSDERYNSGFHCLLSEADAKTFVKILEWWDDDENYGSGKYICKKVRVRCIKSVGVQEEWYNRRSEHAYMPVIVADEMFIPSDEVKG